MLSTEQKRLYRSEIFMHLDGIVTAPSAWQLKKFGVLEAILGEKTCSLDLLAKEFNANAGYLNIALRTLASQGFLQVAFDEKRGQPVYGVNERTQAAYNYIDAYESANELLEFSGRFHPRKFEAKPFDKLQELFNSYCNDLGLLKRKTDIEKSVYQQILAHVEGLIIAPTAVHLAMGGMFHKYFMETSFTADEFHSDPENFEALLDMFVHFGWFSKNGRMFQFTERGLFFARRASAYGVTVSYIPTLRHLDKLIFGDPDYLWGQEKEGDEVHVDREMNVWGSGGAHSSYFKVIDEILIDIFNRPISEQPKGVLDMGCGNGAFIEHIFGVIEQRTARGKVLEEHPLLLVGVDLNDAALRVTRANLINADIWAKVIKGDIGDPDRLSKDLNENYGIELKDLLNVRTFLDHNRPWNMPKNVDRKGRSTGGFAHRGAYLRSADVEASLREHLAAWTPHVRKFGLLIIELHTLPSELTARSLGKTAATAYDATHGYSDQYILEADLFRQIAQEAGLIADDKFSHRFPDNELATVTIDLFKA